MLAAIVQKLKTGSVKNVIAYGSDRPAPPYTVVRPDPDGLGRGWRVRVIGHFLKGQQQYLFNYITGEVMTLLDEYGYTSTQGNDNKVLTEQEISGIISDNDDGTISMERVFLVPSRTF